MFVRSFKSKDFIKRTKKPVNQNWLLMRMKQWEKTGTKADRKRRCSAKEVKPNICGCRAHHHHHPSSHWGTITAHKEESRPECGLGGKYLRYQNPLDWYRNIKLIDLIWSCFANRSYVCLSIRINVMNINMQRRIICAAVSSHLEAATLLTDKWSVPATFKALRWTESAPCCCLA